MRKIIIKCVYLIVVFVLALFVVSTVANQGNTDMTMEMGPASYPVVHMKVQEQEVNCLRGYKQAMECGYQRIVLRHWKRA